MPGTFVHIAIRIFLIVFLVVFSVCLLAYNRHWHGLTISVIIQSIALFSIVPPILGLVFKDFIERYYKKNWEAEAIRGEISDLNRHLKANIAVIDTVLETAWPQNSILRTLHIKRFHILPTSVLASEQTYRLSDPLAMRSVHQFQLFLRNISIDIEEAERIAEANEVAELKTYLLFVRDRFQMGLAAILEVAQILNAVERKAQERRAKYV